MVFMPDSAALMITKFMIPAACGIPVVFAGVGPARAVIESAGLGIAVDYDDEVALADAMVSFLVARPQDTDRQRRARWAENNASLGAQGARAAREALGRVGAKFATEGTK